MIVTPELRAWLTAKTRFPVLATIAPDGLASQSTMWFDLDPASDDTILLNTRVGRRKERHLRRDPRASLCFNDGYDYVTFEGHVELDDDRQRSMEDIRALARRYRSDPTLFDGQERVTVRLRVDRIHRHRDEVRKAEAAALAGREAAGEAVVE